MPSANKELFDYKPGNKFLANDVTLVTSYGYCQSLKINDIRDTSVLRSVRLGGYSVRRWVRVCTGTMKPLPYQRHIPLQFILWENARALKCFASASFDQQELFNFFAINRNYLMLLRMRCFVYFRSGRILFAMKSCVYVYLAVVQIFTAANASEIIHKTRSSI